MLRSAQINRGGSLPAVFASEPGEHFGKGSITVPAYEALHSAARAASTADSAADFQNTLRPLGEQLAGKEFWGMHGDGPRR